MGTAEQQPAVYFEQEGERFIDRVVETVRTTPWSVTLAQLAWTGGPVTFVAMEGAYLLGFGTAAPIKNVVFFVAYTVIAGLVGLATHIVYRSAEAHRSEAAHTELSTVVDRLPDLIFAVRDLYVQSFPPPDRRREAASMLLRKADLAPDAVALAIKDLTDNAELARIAARIELFRRAGLHSRSRDLVEPVKGAADQAVGALMPVAPDAAEALRERLSGRAPSPDTGVPREHNFLERVFSAMETGDLSLITLRDAEDLLVLGFELMSGRSIPMLVLDYDRHWALARATDEVERTRNRYRIAQARVHDRLRTLREHLREHGGEVLPQAPQDLIETTRAHVTELISQLTWVRANRFLPRDEVRHYAGVLAEVVGQADALHKADRDARREYIRFARALRQWEQRAVANGGTGVKISTSGRRGLRLVQRPIRLDDEAKLAVAQSLCGYFHEEGICNDDHRVVRGGTGRAQPLTDDDAKRLALRVAMALEPHVGLSRPEVQRAVHSTNAIFLSGIEMATSAATKAGWGAAMVREVHTNLARAAERLALTLAKTYHVVLDEAAVRFLHEHFGANVERLQTLASSQTASSAPGLPAKPPTLNPALRFTKDWYATLSRARRVLTRTDIGSLRPRAKPASSRNTGDVAHARDTTG